MKLILSRKGFDSGSGGGPSPIIGGVPVSLPIPAKPHNDISRTRYCDIGLGAYVADGAALCHHDPFFGNGRVVFGQQGAAAAHLANQGVGVGDIFLFFGLFSGDGHAPHHRIFGCLSVEQILDVAAGDRPPDFAPDHPHFLNPEWQNNRVFVGRGAAARRACPKLRLTVADGPVSRWRVPDWLHKGRCLSFHGDPRRWLPDNQLQSVARGQEFVVDIATDGTAQHWVRQIISAIESD